MSFYQPHNREIDIMRPSKICTKCNKNKELKYYYWNNFHGRYYARCKVCCDEYTTKNPSAYRKTKNFKKSTNESSRKAYKNHRDKWNARNKTRQAIKKGIITKPTHCEDCDKKCSGHALQAHHEDYTKPLQVIFLCYSCHAEADKLLETKSKPNH